MKKNTKSVKQPAKSATKKVTKKVSKDNTEVVKNCEVRFCKTQVSVSGPDYKAVIRPAKNHILFKESIRGEKGKSVRLVKASLGGAKKGEDGVWSVGLQSEGNSAYSFKFSTRQQALDFKKSFNEFFKA